MISITSCNQGAINHQFHRRVGETKFRIKYSEKEKCFIFVYKGILYQLVVGKCKRKGFSVQWYDLKIIRNLYLPKSHFYKSWRSSFYKSIRVKQWLSINDKILKMTWLKIWLQCSWQETWIFLWQHFKIITRIMINSIILITGHTRFVGVLYLL